jgi:PPK2 family polyphosphate:nucleotide phosphotransferase
MRGEDVERKELRRRAREVVDDYRVTKGKGFSLADFDPGDTHDLVSDRKDEAKELLGIGVQRLAELQDMLYAQDRWSVLLVFQAMDAAGKDSTIKHVMSGVNPQGVQVYSFKQPSSEELDHDYLWRYQRSLPERGRIGIFNRSYYEEVLVVRVHEQVLAAQKLPQQLVTKRIWDERYEDIRAFERHMTRNGTRILKFFLHVSKEEQRKRFLERIDDPSKNWKFSGADLKERGYRKQYLRAFEEAIRETADEDAPWFVVPADNKWFTRLVVAAAIVSEMADLDLHYPKIDAAQRRELRAARDALMKEKS